MKYQKVAERLPAKCFKCDRNYISSSQSISCPRCKSAVCPEQEVSAQRPLVPLLSTILTIDQLSVLERERERVGDRERKRESESETA